MNVSSTVIPVYSGLTVTVTNRVSVVDIAQAALVITTPGLNATIIGAAFVLSVTIALAARHIAAVVRWAGKKGL